MDGIEKKSLIDRTLLNPEHYFSSLIQEAHAKKLISDAEMERVQIELIENLSEAIKGKEDGFSSSMRVEAAQSLMDSRVFQIGLCLKSYESPEAAVEAIKEEKMSDLSKKGIAVALEKMESAKELYSQALKNRIQTGNNGYNVMMDEKASRFFAKYDPYFGAQETHGSLRYPVASVSAPLAGIEFMEEYLSSLCCENIFCGRFQGEYINRLSCFKEENRRFNIFEQVFSAALGLKLCGRSCADLGLCREDIKEIAGKLGGKTPREQAKLIAVACGEVFEETALNQVDADPLQRFDARSYIIGWIPKLTEEIILAAKRGALEGFFPVSQSVQDARGGRRLLFSLGKNMSEADYRKMIADILRCELIFEKVSIILDRVRSLADLDNLFFDAELDSNAIIEIFKQLAPEELAAIHRRHFGSKGEDIYSISSDELAFREILKEFIGSLHEDLKDKVMVAIEDIEFE
jgi:hypothetical protein